MSANTVRLHRVIRTTAARIYRAFLDADAMAKWLPPYGFTCKVHHMDARVDGTFKMSFINFTTGAGHAFGGTYRELVPHELPATAGVTVSQADSVLLTMTPHRTGLSGCAACHATAWKRS
jgi:uncharacterized protein YndB with AHSA1/START domain